jgi:hypothetical protein
MFVPALQLGDLPSERRLLGSGRADITRKILSTTNELADAVDSNLKHIKEPRCLGSGAAEGKAGVAIGSYNCNPGEPRPTVT